MSRCLRYRDSVICEHLASQYVAGLMTSLARKRMEALLVSTPELDRAVAFWADKMAAVQTQLPDQQPSADLWPAIESRLADNELDSVNISVRSDSLVHSPWWKNLLLWQLSSVTGAAISLVFGIMLMFAPSTPVPVTVGPSYLAAMSISGSTSPSAQEIDFVVSAYKKTEENPSWLQVQWSKQSDNNVSQVLHLWAENRETKELTYIGVQPDDKRRWTLIAGTWKAIATSGRLLATSNEQLPSVANTLFVGPCIQLKSWKSQTI